MANNAKFNLDLKKYINTATKEGEKEIRSVGLAGLKGVMRKTPVDNGTARGNWNVGLNEINETFQTDFTKNPDFGRFDIAGFGRGNSVIGEFKSGDSINISNALPYINRLEFTDHSAQGNGMVRRTKAELISELKKKKGKV